eukprot:m.119666 g.119666  ORF g.119666 m.119666 type:complete len:516 (-) comp14326_c0_seq2:1682-3229(-)
MGLLEKNPTMPPPKALGDSMAPSQPEDRVWTTWSFVSMWLSISIQPAGFVLGASLLDTGLSWAEASIAIVLGNLVLLGPMTLNAIPGAKYGINFPVLCRSAFGLRGAQVTAISRCLIAMGWASFCLWLGAKGIYYGLLSIWPSLKESPELDDGLNLPLLLCFIFNILLHIALIIGGIKNIEKSLRIAGPVQSVGLLCLVVWGLSVATPVEISHAADSFINKTAAHDEGRFLRVVTGTTAVCAGWSTLALNIADLSRYSKSTKSLLYGQIIGFPPGNILCPVMGILVAAAAKHIYGKSMWDLVSLFKHWSAPVAVISSLVFLLSTLSVNITANLISGANDIGNLWPTRISFRIGGIVSILIAACMLPWRVFSSSHNFIMKFLVAYSIVTGALLGVLLAHYYVVDKRTINVAALYPLSSLRGSHGPYEYFYGYNLRAFASVILSTIPCLPGLISYLRNEDSNADFEDNVWTLMYRGSWIVTLVLSFTIHVIISCISPRSRHSTMDSINDSETESLVS